MTPAVQRISLVEAIARQEGFGKPDTRATRNHNPGNINWGVFAREHGAIGPDDKKYAVFMTNDQGFAALRALLSRAPYKGMTLEAALRKYCPPTGDERGENDTPRYILNVCMWCGAEPSTIIDGLIESGELY